MIAPGKEEEDYGRLRDNEKRREDGGLCDGRC